MTRPREENNFGEGTPFMELMDLGGKVLGLGVSFAFTTFYHVFEDLHLDRFQGVYDPRPLPARMKINTEIREVRE